MALPAQAQPEDINRFFRKTFAGVVESSAIPLNEQRSLLDRCNDLRCRLAVDSFLAAALAPNTLMSDDPVDTVLDEITMLSTVGDAVQLNYFARDKFTVAILPSMDNEDAAASTIQLLHDLYDQSPRHLVLDFGSTIALCDAFLDLLSQFADDYARAGFRIYLQWLNEEQIPEELLPGFAAKFRLKLKGPFLFSTD